jgi:hypothetical protein
MPIEAAKIPPPNVISDEVKSFFCGVHGGVRVGAGAAKVIAASSDKTSIWF